MMMDAQNAQGKMLVFLRVRPMYTGGGAGAHHARNGNGSANAGPSIRALNDSDSVFAVEDKTPQPFSFDRVFDPRSSERDVYEAAQVSARWLECCVDWPTDRQSTCQSKSASCLRSDCVNFHSHTTAHALTQAHTRTLTHGGTFMSTMFRRAGWLVGWLVVLDGPAAHAGQHRESSARLQQLHFRVRPDGFRKDAHHDTPQRTAAGGAVSAEGACARCGDRQSVVARTVRLSVRVGWLVMRCPPAAACKFVRPPIVRSCSSMHSPPTHASSRPSVCVCAT